MPRHASPLPARRVLALVLPFLSTDRILRQRRGRSWRHTAAPPDAPPLAVTDRLKSAVRLVALDEVALGCGLSPGQTLAEARAMIPALEAVEADADADARLLGGIADWAERYTPLVGLAGSDGLMLDITGCAHLFGGEAALLRDLLARVRAEGFAVAAAIADTPGAAFAVAAYGRPGVVPPGGSHEALRCLPLPALRLPADIVAGLERVGLRTIGQIAEAPRAPLAVRFGAALLRRLDQASGREEEAISPRRPMPQLFAERRFAEPVSLEADIAATVLSLAGTLEPRLTEGGVGGRHFELSLYRTDGAVERAEIATGRPLRAPHLVAELFAEKFTAIGDDFDAGFGFDLIRLAVLAVDRATAAQIDLTGEADGTAGVERLVDRLGARLGLSRVLRLSLQESHIPERSARALMASATVESASWPEHAADDPIDRPLRLLDRPEPVDAIAEIPEGPPLRFRWRRALYEVARAEGPERIAAEWWREDGLTRDYYRVEDRAGHRFWLYRDGLYSEADSPRWFMQGLLA
ncbi:MAG: DNA polymerase Y family protein [Bauldia sp.]|nr:DNA polymerase Y family protein [Bauldia sp.]